MESDVSRELSVVGAQQVMKDFIAEYRNSPELWNTRDENYTNTYHRAHAQERLLKILRRIQSDATKIDVRKKINTIRSNYNKKAALVKAAEARGEIYVPKHWMYHELRFLDTIVKPYPKVPPSTENESDERSNERGDESGDESGNERVDSVEYAEEKEIKFETAYPDAINYIEIGDGSQDAYEMADHSDYTEPVVKKPNVARHIVIDGTSANQHRRVKVPQRLRLEAKPERSSQEANTAVEPIALVWSSKLQALRSTQRLFAEKAINDILFEASLNNLQKGPMVVNVGMSSVTVAKPDFAEEAHAEYLDVSIHEGDVS